MTYFYAMFNEYGSDTSVGFDNTNEVRAFTTKAARDEFVAENEDSNLSVMRITKKQALKIEGDLAYRQATAY